MPNTVFGPYIATVWQQNVTAANATNMNHLETGPIYALHGYNADLLSPYVDHGIVASKDGTVLNQLNVTAGRAYVTVLDSSGLASLALIATVSSTASQFLTSTPSTTYYLFLNTDGTWQWGTTSTGATNSLAICSATTDGSGNISVVTDKRTLAPTLFPNATNTGVAAIVAKAVEVHVTATTFQNILTYTPAASGFFRACLHIYKGNATSNALVAQVTFTGNHGALSSEAFFADMSAIATTAPDYMDGSQTASSGPFDFPTSPITFYAAAGGAIIIGYQDPTGTPDDYITATLERLA